MSAHGSLRIDPTKQAASDAAVAARFHALDTRLRADVEEILERSSFTGPVALTSEAYLARRTLDLLDRHNLGR